jgi:NAD(P)H-dependent FMN reductase
MQLLAISGSLRVDSTNSALLRSLNRFAPKDARVDVYTELGTLPIFNPDLEGKNTPMVVERLAQQVSSADGLIISSPEYGHGIPGGLKNLLDWLTSRFEIVDKPILLLHASHRGDVALQALCEVLKTLSRNMMPDVSIRVPLVSYSLEEVEETISRPEYAESISNGLHDFISWIRQRS